MANVRAKVSSVDPVWERMTQEAEQAIRDEPLLGGQIHSALLHHPSIENALAYRIAMKLTNSEMSEQLIREICDEAYRADPALAATGPRSPTCPRAGGARRRRYRRHL